MQLNAHAQIIKRIQMESRASAESQTEKRAGEVRRVESERMRRIDFPICISNYFIQLLSIGVEPMVQALQNYEDEKIRCSLQLLWIVVLATFWLSHDLLTLNVLVYR